MTEDHEVQNYLSNVKDTGLGRRRRKKKIRLAMEITIRTVLPAAIVDSVV